MANTKVTNGYEHKSKFIQCKIAKEIYDYQHKARINKSMKSKLKIMQDILSHPRKLNFETQTAHLFVREPDVITYGNACLEADDIF